MKIVFFLNSLWNFENEIWTSLTFVFLDLATSVEAIKNLGTRGFGFGPFSSCQQTFAINCYFYSWDRHLNRCCFVLCSHKNTEIYEKILKDRKGHILNNAGVERRALDFGDVLKESLLRVFPEVACIGANSTVLKATKKLHEKLFWKGQKIFSQRYKSIRF